MVHTLRLDNYSPTPRKLVLGTNSSFGTESIKIERGAGWDGLNLTATWHIPGREEPLRVALLDGDAMDVPPEVTKEAKDGVLVLAGLASGVQRASCNVEYLILEQAGVYGGADAEPTPGLAAQVLKAALQAKADAEAAAEDAAAAKANAEKAAADAAKAGPYAEAARAAQEAAESARDEAIAAQRAAENAAAAAAASKSAADTLAAEAARAALAAENSKTTANNAANLAGENATAAQQAADTATAAANDAGQSASDAAASKAAAETAAKDAQGAQTAAAAAKAEAVKAQEAAQTAAKSAQDAQAAAEKVRDEAKTAQKGAEDARDAAAKSAEAAAKSEANAKQSADTLAESVENVAANTAAVAELKEKKAEIDDTAVGANAWSSKHIVDMLFPPLEESGNPVVCYPVAGYPLGVKASWEPVQEGTGTPSPENIRPIKGRDSVTVERCGENLLNPELNAYKTFTPYGLTVTYIGDNKVHLKGTYTAEGGGGYFVILDSNQKLLAGRNLKVTGFTIEGGKQTYRLYGLRTKDETLIAMNAKFAKGDVIDMTVAIVVSKDTPATYTPYIGQTNALTLPETVYGGEVDAVSGNGVKTKRTMNFIVHSNDSVNMNASADMPFVSVYKECSAVGMRSNPKNEICNILPWVDWDSIVSDTSPVDVDTCVMWGAGSSFGIALNKAYIGLTDESSDDDVVKAAINFIKSLPVPIQICYTLAEPVSFTATGAQALPALAGLNTILTDADSATVTGRADPIKHIEDLEAAVASIN